jgi:hypothetical protein
MTSTILWAVLAAVAVLAIGVGVAIAVVVGKARAPAVVAPEVHPVDRGCAGGGHAYRADGTGWRCVHCGNYASRVEGEVYGRAEDGRVDRRREPR